MRTAFYIEVNENTLCTFLAFYWKIAEREEKSEVQNKHQIVYKNESWSPFALKFGMKFNFLC